VAPTSSGRVAAILYAGVDILLTDMLSTTTRRGKQASDGSRDGRKQRPLPVGCDSALHREDRAHECRGEPQSTRCEARGA
jgi:hypothetical protein